MPLGVGISGPAGGLFRNAALLSQAMERQGKPHGGFDPVKLKEFQEKFPGARAFSTEEVSRPGFEEQGASRQSVRVPTNLFSAFLGGGLGGFGGQEEEEEVVPAFQPGDDPNTMQAAAARQDAAAAAGDGFSDPIVAGRREALLARRGRGIGLAGLGRGFTARNLLATTPV